MAQVLTDVASVPRVSVSTRVAAIPWYLWCSALAVTSAYIGGYWDISWHRSIGRDTFWSAPHLAIYACGVLAGISSGYLILTATFSRESPLRAAGVRIWGLYGPLGAFISAWGGVAMLASAPFDDWWHNAYGLDVKIISPPHMVLASGFFSIIFGTLVLVLGFLNRAGEEAKPALQRLLLYAGGLALSESLLLKLEYIDRSHMHGALFYIVVMIGSPAILTAVAIGSGHRWACTVMASVYSVVSVALLWILPLFPAEPKLGPVYTQVTHFIPWEFPLLVIVPAFAMDLVRAWTASMRPLARAALIGAVFMATFIAVQWPFADFLMTPSARNWFFGTQYLGYNTSPRSAYARFMFFDDQVTPAIFGRGMAVALGASCLFVWIGLHVGRWMQRVRR